MNILNNSTIDTVIDFANVKFGMELTKEQVVGQLKGLSFSQTLKNPRLTSLIELDPNENQINNAPTNVDFKIIKSNLNNV